MAALSAMLLVAASVAVAQVSEIQVGATVETAPDPHLYNRGDNAKVGVFRIADGAIDGVTGMDGVDVTNFGLGSAFPSGLLSPRTPRTGR